MIRCLIDGSDIPEKELKHQLLRQLIWELLQWH